MDDYNATDEMSLVNTTLAAMATSGKHGSSLVHSYNESATTPGEIGGATVPISTSSELLSEVFVTAFKALHIVLATLALGSNCLSLCVIYGFMDRVSRPLQILTGLAFGEMLTPWAVVTSYFPKSSCQEEIHTAMMLTGHNVCSLTVLLLAVSLNIATFRPFTYEKIVSHRRLWVSINAIWITAITTAHLHFLLTLVMHHHHGNHGYCRRVRENTSIVLIMSLSIASSAIIVAITMYGRILRHLRPMEALRADHSESPKSARGVVTGILLAVSYSVTWVPYLFVKFAEVHNHENPSEGVKQALQIIQSVILLGCIWDPLIYGLRMNNVQMGYLRMYHRGRGYVVRLWTRLSRHRDAEELPSTPLNPIESVC